MTDREALLATILANPDDDLARLVYADFIEENGENETAEFIRTQCELERLECTAIDRPKQRRGEWCSSLVANGTYKEAVCDSCKAIVLLRGRERELNSKIASPFAFPMGIGVDQAIAMSDIRYESVSRAPVSYAFYRRGFIHAVICNSATWLDHGGELAKREPVEAVALTSELPLGITNVESRDEHDTASREWRFQVRWRVQRADRDFSEEMAMRQIVSEREVMWKGGDYLDRFVELFRRECRANATVEGYLKMKWPKVTFTMDGGEPPGPGRDLDDAVRYGGFIWIWHHGRWQNRGRDELRFRTYYGREILTWEEYQQRGQRSQRDRLIMGTYEPYMQVGMTAAPLSFDYESYSQSIIRQIIDSFAISPAIYNPPITHAASWDDGGGSPIDDLRRAADEIRDQSRGE